MADALEFTDGARLATWLKDKPADWAQAIAVRSALRVFPLVVSIADVSDGPIPSYEKQDLILRVWRAMFISWTVLRYPVHDIGAAVATACIAVRGTSDTETSAVAYAAAAVEHAAKVSGDTDVDAATAAAYAATFAANAVESAGYAKDITNIWAAVHADMQFLATSGDPKKALLQLFLMPVWIKPDVGSGMYQAISPELTKRAFDQFANLDWVRNSPWKMIIDWCKTVSPYYTNAKPRSLFGEKADVEIATQPDEFWEREPVLVMEAIAEIAGWRSKEKKDNFTVAQFIIDFLESVEDTATINEIRAAFVAAEYQVIDKTMRGTLSQLAKTGKIQRVETGVYARNAWLLKRFDEILETDEFLDDSSEIIENLEPQVPAAFRFEWSDEKIVAQAPGTFTPDSETAQDLLDDIRRKALSLAERLERSNAEKRVRDSIQSLIDVLSERVADLRPGLLRSRSRSIEADAVAYADAIDERELFPDAVAALTDLSETLRDLQGCFPQLREIEAEIMALDIDPAKAEEVKTNLDKIVDAVSDNENVVDQSAVYALHTMEGIASEDASPAVKQKRIAEYALVVRNFMSPLARFALDNALSKAVTKATEDVWVKARPRIIDGVADGMGSMARPGTIIAIASLVHVIFGPAAAIAAAAAGFGKIDRLLKLVEKWLVKTADAINHEEETERSPEDLGS
jgi:hypothetical protein